MRKLLNTLFVTSENAFLSLDGETVVVELGSQKAGQFPLHTLENVICFSYRGATPALMGACASHGVGLSFYTPYGKYLCNVEGETQGNILLRKTQYRISDNESMSCLIARNMILGKVFNCRWSIDRTLRDHELRVNAELCEKSIRHLSEKLYVLKEETVLDTLRGMEGECAGLYFGVFDELILNQKENFFFHGRNRRPPLDFVNAMLSFGYRLLENDCTHALESVGLDPYAGFMHRDRPGRKSLSLDLMEELRPLFVDRFVLTLINNRQIKASHFEKSDSGAVLFTDAGRKLFLAAWQERKRDQVTHPYLQEKVSWGLIPFVQALLLARKLRGDIDEYPPFLWK